MAFDPDAYLSELGKGKDKGAVSGFDPNAYLKELGIEPPPEEPGFLERIFGGKKTQPPVETGLPAVPTPEEMVGAVTEEAPAQTVPAITPGGFQPELLEEQFKTGVTGMQEGYYANAAKNNALLLNVMDRIDRGEKVSPSEDTLGYLEMDPETRKQTKDAIQSAMTGAVSKNIAYGAERQGYKRNENADLFIGLADKGELKNAWNVFRRDPIGIIQQLSVESAPNALPSMVAGGAGILLRGGLAGFMTGLATGSFPVEYTASIVDSLRDSGVDLKDAKAVEAKLRDPEFLEAAGKRAMTRGTVIAAADAASGKLLMPLKAGQLAKNAVRGATNIVSESGMQMFGEAAAQVASGENIQLGQVIAEGLGAGPQTAAGTVLRTLAEGSKPSEAELRTEAKKERIEPTITPEEAPPTAPAAPAVPETAPPTSPEAVAPEVPAAAPEAAAPEAAPAVPDLDFVNQKTNMGSKITQISSGKNAGQYAVTAYDLDSGMPLREVRIYKEPERANAYAQDVIGVKPVEAPAAVEEPIKPTKPPKLTKEERAAANRERQARQRAEAAGITVPKIAEKTVEGLPLTKEEEEYAARREADIKATVADIEKLSVPRKEDSLLEFFYYRPQKAKPGEKPKEVFDNRLSTKEAIDIASQRTKKGTIIPDKKLGFIHKEGGASISSFIKSQQLNPWLPEELVITGNESAEEMADKEPAAEEHIKEALRNKDYLPTETKRELQRLNTSLEQIEREIQQEVDLDNLRDILEEILAEEQGRTDIEPPVTEVEAPSRAEPARAAAEPILTQYTAAKEEARLRRADEEREAAEQKAIADREREAFALTPQAAEREAAPTGDLFGARGLAEQPAKPKAPAPEVKEGLFAEEKPVKEKLTEKQIQNAKDHADEVGGEVVYQKGDYALIRGYSLLSGDPVYVPTSGTSRAKVDIERFTGKQVPADIREEMIKVKNDTEAAAAKEHKENPFIKFDNGVALSKDISPEVAGVIRGWKDLLKINVPIYVSTVEDAKANRNNFTGPHRRIGSGTLDERERGSMRRMADDSYYILFKESTSPTLMLETIAHEMGHLHERLFYDKASSEEKAAVRSAFDKWLASQKGKTAKELVESLRGRATARRTIVPKGQMADEMTSYWKSFGEWYADQVSRWAVSAQEPISIVDKFFKRLANQLRQFYQRVKNTKYLPDETFVQYLKKANRDPVNLEPPIDRSEKMIEQQGFDFDEEDTEGMVESKAAKVEQDIDRDTGITEPPKLERPEDYKPMKGRQEQVTLAARLLTDGDITKAQYDDYVNHYMPVAEIPLNKMDPALTNEQLITLLNRPSVKANKNPSLFNAPIPKGTRVGLRMDIPAVLEGQRLGTNGSVVSVHEGSTSKSRVGKNLSYTSTGAVKNAVMAIRKESEALGVAEGLEGKKPQQTIEGDWMAMTPEQVMEQVRNNFNDPAWVQVGFDPLRHSFFYNRRDMRPIVSADEVLQVGRFVLAKNPVYAPREQFLYDLNPSAVDNRFISEEERVPSFTREFDRLDKQLKKGYISSDDMVAQLMDARERLRAARGEKDFAALKRGRQRGALIIKEKLLAAQRRGELPAGAVELADWFISQNPDLVNDLAISISAPKEGGPDTGAYYDLSRMMKIIKGSVPVTTPIHEMLHHTERMMPKEVQEDIQSSWLKSFLDNKKLADASNDKALQKYYQLLSDFHFVYESQKNLEQAIELIKNGSVAYNHYQNFNPSEFWAVNASRIVKGRFDVQGSTLKKLKNWLRELGQKIKDLFGMKSDAPIIRALDSLAKSDGKFVTSVMLGNGLGVYNSIVNQNILGQPTPNPTWSAPDEHKMDDAIYVLQDKYIDTKRVEQEITNTIGQIEDKWSPYLQEELYHGRTAKQTNNFLQDELRPLLKKMQSLNMDLAELEEYLHNRHAEERNIQIAKVNPNMPDGGSGILTADAQTYLANLNPARKAELELVAKMVDDITKGTREILVNSGLETRATVNKWEKTYGNYIPLNREEADYDMNRMSMGVGQGFSTRGPATRRAIGSERKVINILANIAAQRERTIVRSEKQRIGQALYGLAVTNPNPDFWLPVDPAAMKDPKAAAAELLNMGLDPADVQNIIKEPKVSYVDPTTNQVVTRVNPLFRSSDHVLPVRINGTDRFVYFNPRDPRAARMVEALKNMDADQLSTALSMVGRLTRYFSAINTQYNPIFGVINFSRDVQGAMIQVSNTPIADMKTQIVTDSGPAMKGIYDDLRARRKGQALPAGKWANLWEEFQREGGQTGFRDQFSRSQEREDALVRELKQLSEGKIKKGARAIINWLSDYNETLENAVRLAAYKAGLDKGLTKQRAASVAKNLTVNFNRKGAIARYASALYAFFNANVQGSKRMYDALRGPAGKKIFYGGLILGSMQALLLAAAGFDDDEPTDFVKEKNLIIPIGGKKYVNIPMPLGYNVIPNTSRILTEWALSGFKDTAKRAFLMTGALLDAFNPIGNAGWSMQTFAPTIADPAVALFENKDWTGRPIAKKDISSLDPTPGYTRAKDTASWFSKKLAEFFNYASGGTKYRPGMISPTPDQIDYLIGQATGGVGREVLRAEQTVRGAVTGEETPSYKIPLVGRFYGEAKSQAAQRDKFYKNIQLLNEHENEIKGRRKNREDVQEYIEKNPEAKLFTQANNVERQIQQLRKRRESLLGKNAPKSDVKDIEERITEVMNRFNQAVEQAKKR